MIFIFIFLKNRIEGKRIKMRMKEIIIINVRKRLKILININSYFQSSYVIAV